MALQGAHPALCGIIRTDVMQPELTCDQQLQELQELQLTLVSLHHVAGLQASHYRLVKLHSHSFLIGLTGLSHG